jgi:hypothetical protein
VDLAGLARTAHVHEDHCSWALGGGVILSDRRYMGGECSLLLPCSELGCVEALRWRHSLAESAQRLGGAHDGRDCRRVCESARPVVNDRMWRGMFVQ